MPEFSLAALELVDAPAEPSFDNLTRLASTLLGAPVSLVSIVEAARDRQFFKSQFGLEATLADRRQTPLSHSFCRHVVEHDETLVVDDANAHELVKANLAIEEHGVVAYLGAPIRDEDETPLGALCVIDSTPRRWSEADIENLERLAGCVSDTIHMKALLRRGEALRREQREFAYAISHDLKSPINTLRLVLNELAADDESTFGETSRKLLGIGLSTLDRADALIEAVLGYARSATCEFEPEAVDLASLTDAVREDLRGDIERVGATLDIGTLPTVRGQPLQLRMLLQNLISNALKFSRPGVPPSVRVSAVEDETGTAVAVADDGIGIDPADRDRVFELFRRLHIEKDYPGSGLGLALCRRVAANHGGRIELTDSPGGGSTFTLRLPRSAA